MVEKLSVVVELVGGKEVEQEVTGIANAFDGATKSIASLGKTGAEALNSAAAAAQKFGASAAQLRQVEGIINALNARSRDSTIAFSTLAANYDKARSSAGNFAQATQQAGQAVAQIAGKVSSFRPELTALSASMAAMGLPFGGLISAFGRVGSSFGIFAGGAVAVAGAATALIKFANAAAETANTLGKLRDVSGKSFEQLSAVQQVFAKGGTSAKEFGAQFTALFQGISQASKTTAADVAESTARVAQAEADAFRRALQSGRIVGVQNEAILRQLDAHAAKTKAIAEANKGLVTQANDLGAVINQFERLAQGEQVALAPLTTMETAIKALDNALANVGKRGGDQFQALANIIKGLPIAQARELQQALKMPDATFDTLREGSEALKNAQQDVKNLGLTLTETNEKDLKVFENAYNDLTATISAATQKIGAQAAPELTRGLEAVKQSVLDLVNLPIGENLMHSLQGIGQVLKQVFVDSWVAIGSATLRSFQTGFINPIVEAAGLLPGLIMSGLSSLGGMIATFVTTPVAGAWQWISDTFSVVLEQVKAKALAVDIKGLFSSSDAAAPAASGNGGGNARGGLLGGRGTGTSDSNLAWVSRGEHIMPAAAVRQPGVLALLEALRRSGGNLSRVLDGMGRFALGGMVRGPMPAFASGGLAGGMSNVTIQFPGLPAIGGLRASSAVVDELHKAAALAQVRSGGRKPSRYS